MYKSIGTFKHDRQPYGCLTLKEAYAIPITVETHGNYDHVRHCESKGLYEVTGIVAEGGEMSRLLHVTSFRSMRGEKHSVWAVSQDELDRGVKVTVAM